MNRNNREELEEEYRANGDNLRKWFSWLPEYAEYAEYHAVAAKEKDLDEARAWLETLHRCTTVSLHLIEQMERLLVHPNWNVEVSA